MRLIDSGPTRGVRGVPRASRVPTSAAERPPWRAGGLWEVDGPLAACSPARGIWVVTDEGRVVRSVRR